jgi:uncharacterized protein YbjT (DUF2867 family)
MASNNKVLVFGPTGNVGSTAALTAQQLGAKVYLAMRDTTKPVPNLTTAQEQELGLERVHADLTQPETVTKAVAQAGGDIKAAFLYLAYGSPDHMRATAEALKAAGVAFVVFLSSGSVQSVDLRAVQPTDWGAWLHAQVELVLGEVFGEQRGFAAVRPCYFASNILLYLKNIAAGETARVVYPDAKFDFIVTEDIGRVCGNLLARGPDALRDGSNVVFLAGPQLISQEAVLQLFGKALGKEVKVEGFEDEEEMVRFVTEKFGVPEVGARQLVDSFRGTRDGTPLFREEGAYEKAVANIEKYGGKPATTVQQWVEATSATFAA